MKTWLIKIQNPRPDLNRKPRWPVQPRKPFKFTITHALWVAGILALLIGAIGLFQRFTEGLRRLRSAPTSPGGLWVATYEYLVWLEVGSLLVFTLLVYFFNWPKDLERMAPTLYLSALAILSMALHPDRSGPRSSLSVSGMCWSGPNGAR
ncbi:MAG: hypothetical protein MZV65_35905 [Chromatiales bacterium]|nr:hypothetical protein [Chromatiales bacterium]